jgi:hypothetical protein
MGSIGICQRQKEFQFQSSLTFVAVVYLRLLLLITPKLDWHYVEDHFSIASEGENGCLLTWRNFSLIIFPIISTSKTNSNVTH